LIGWMNRLVGCLRSARTVMVGCLLAMLTTIGEALLARLCGKTGGNRLPVRPHAQFNVSRYTTSFTPMPVPKFTPLQMNGGTYVAPSIRSMGGASTASSIATMRAHVIHCRERF
jgi:hypothetical protein